MVKNIGYAIKPLSPLDTVEGSEGIRDEPDACQGSDAEVRLPTLPTVRVAKMGARAVIWPL